MKSIPHITVIDPAVRVPELDVLNRISGASPLSITYHLPGLHGMRSLELVAGDPAGIVLLGSGSSVHDALPWQQELGAWLRARMEAGIPTLGLCFGHQFVAHLFGAEVGYLRQDRAKHLGFFQTQLEPDALWGGKAVSGELYCAHREQVIALPPGFRSVGRSGDLPLEALRHESLPLWTFQAHPEATRGFIENQGDTLPAPGRLAFGHSLVDAFLDFCGGKREARKYE